MQLFTDYPLLSAENPGIFPVTALAYDCNKYVTVQFAGHTYEVKSGYLYKDLALTKRVSSRDVYRLPYEIGGPRKTERQVAHHFSRKNRRTTQYFVVAKTPAGDSATTHKSLSAAISKIKSAIRSKKYETIFLTSCTKTARGFETLCWMGITGDEIHDFLPSSSSSRSTGLLPFKWYRALSQAIVSAR